MEHKERNEQIRQKILAEIADIEAFSRQREVDALKADRMYQKAIIMSLINIGELSKSFTEDFLAATPQIPWKAIRGSATSLPISMKSLILTMFRKRFGKMFRS